MRTITGSQPSANSKQGELRATAIMRDQVTQKRHMDDHPHLTEQQLALRWGVSVKKLQADRLKGGGIPFIRLGRAVRYRYADVMAWEEQHRLTSTSGTLPADRVSSEQAAHFGHNHKTSR